MSSHPAAAHSAQLCACARQDGGGKGWVPSPNPSSPITITAKIPGAAGAWRLLSSTCPEQDQPQRAAQDLGPFFIPWLQKTASRSFGGGEEGEHSLPGSQWDFGQVGISSWSCWLWAQGALNGSVAELGVLAQPRASCGMYLWPPRS